VPPHRQLGHSCGHHALPRHQSHPKNCKYAEIYTDLDIVLCCTNSIRFAACLPPSQRCYCQDGALGARYLERLGHHWWHCPHGYHDLSRHQPHLEKLDHKYAKIYMALVIILCSISSIHFAATFQAQ